MRLVIDAFGGDNAPGAIIEGCVNALNVEGGFDIILTGDEKIISDELEKYQYNKKRIMIKHAPDRIEMQDSPVQAIKKKTKSSLVVALNAVASKEADVLISSGSTGAVLAGATLLVKRIKGVKRSALAPVLPTISGGGVLLIDCGANVDCKPVYLQQFGIMGSVYMSTVFGIKSPRVGLINNGIEPEKGNALALSAYKLLQGSDINFKGNVEARDIMSGEFDVAVADGFVGNIALKSVEGTAMLMFAMLKQELTKGLGSKLGALLLKPAFRRVKKEMDYAEYGGALLLGIDGGIIKTHGSANAKTITAAIFQAKKMADKGVVDKIREEISKIDFEGGED